MENGFFKNIEKKTGVNMKDVMDLANSLQHANLQDEKTIRGVIKKVAKMANKSVPRELEDHIVNSVVKDGKKLDMQTLTNMMNKGK